MPKQTAQKAKKKKIDWRRVLVILLAASMLIALILPQLGSLSGHAATQGELKDQISGLKDTAAAAKQRKQELANQLAAINSDKAKALERKNLMDQQLYAIDDQIANTQSQIEAYNTLIAGQEEVLAVAQAKENSAYERFCSRARAMEEAGEISYLSVVFQADSFTDLLDRLAMVDEIVAYDNAVVENLVAAREEVEGVLAELHEYKEGLEEQKAVLDDQRAEQAVKATEAQALFDELKGKADAVEALEKAEREEEARIAREIDKKQKQLDDLILQEKIKLNLGTGYAYPLPAANRTITSKFGYRRCPFHGPESHTGLDIAAPAKTPIGAIQGGVVVTSSYAPSSYGNYVVLSHGSGATTLYAHMSSRAVKVGDVVSQGQTIGYVGTTGSSNGNHLHIEWKINGVRQDPMGMFPNIPFIDHS